MTFGTGPRLHTKTWNTKPHLYKFLGTWYCVGRMCQAVGATPDDAYAHWGAKLLLYRD